MHNQQNNDDASRAGRPTHQSHMSTPTTNETNKEHERTGQKQSLARLKDSAQTERVSLAAEKETQDQRNDTHLREDERLAGLRGQRRETQRVPLRQIQRRERPGKSRNEAQNMSTWASCHSLTEHRT